MDNKILSISFTKVYSCYIIKAERKGRKKQEVDMIIRWLTGYSQRELNKQIKKEVSLQTFFEEAPKPNPLRGLIKGTICGIKIDEIKEPITREIRYLDKLIDELAKGREMGKILRE